MIEPAIYITQLQGEHLRKMDKDPRRVKKIPMLNHNHIKILKAQFQLLVKLGHLIWEQKFLSP